MKKRKSKRQGRDRENPIAVQSTESKTSQHPSLVPPIAEVEPPQVAFDIVLVVVSSRSWPMCVVVRAQVLRVKVRGLTAALGEGYHHRVKRNGKHFKDWRKMSERVHQEVFKVISIRLTKVCHV